ncbi:hypothetical protein ACIQ57_21190 [Lysinibacillus xylanilyticus]
MTTSTISKDNQYRHDLLSPRQTVPESTLYNVETPEHYEERMYE